MRESGRTEARHPRAGAARTSAELLALMNEEDALVPAAVAARLDEIGRAVDLVVAALERGGRLRYVGAGTSGRLGVLDAAEAPPTFGVPEDVVRGILAGGAPALTSAVEGAEDDVAAAERDVRAAVRPGDALVGISASGSTPYVLRAVEVARAAGAATIALTCDPESPLARAAQHAIALDVGPEVLAGSTRLKAGTATKLVLNMLSTAAMVRLGRTRGDLMADLRAVNDKLRRRAVGIVMAEAGVSAGEARRRLEACDWDIRRAIN